jgi:hypothetical protein
MARTEKEIANLEKIASLEEAAAWLAKMEESVETNEGTYGAVEARRAVGTGDPVFANYTIWERVGDGTTRVQGCDPDRAPGRGRKYREAINAKRAELKSLREQIAAAKKAAR